MGKKEIQISLLTKNVAVVIFGIGILISGLDYFYFAKQIAFFGLPVPHLFFVRWLLSLIAEG